MYYLLLEYEDPGIELKDLSFKVVFNDKTNVSIAKRSNEVITLETDKFSHNLGLML